MSHAPTNPVTTDHSLHREVEGAGSPGPNGRDQAPVAIPTHLMHAHGGTILSVDAIGHNTIDGTADWWFECRVRFDGDQFVSLNIKVPPHALCTDGSPEGAEALQSLRRLMAEYLDAEGTWHDDRWTRDGRCYWWTPQKKAGRLVLTGGAACS